MASKANPQPVQVASPEELRNVVLVGSAGSGKTTLFEHLLRSRVPGYRGEKDDPERAATLTLGTFRSGDVVVNLLDAPGHPDYVGELRAGLRAADACIFVISAADGIDGITAALWRECAAVSVPRAIAITKLDTGRASFEEMVQACQDQLTPGILPSYLPLRTGDDTLVGNMSLVTFRVHDYSSGSRVSGMADDEQHRLIEEYRAPFLEGVVAEADDDELMERYLEGDELSRDEVLGNLTKAVTRSHFFPVIPVQVSNSVGTEELLGMIERAFPSPCDVPVPEATTPDLADEVDVECSPDAPLVAEVIRTMSDQFAGRQQLVRLYSGTLKPDDMVHVSGHRAEFAGRADAEDVDHDVEERVGPVSGLDVLDPGPLPRAIAGQIVLVGKLSRAETSDTLSSPGRPALIEPWALPDALLPVAIRAATRNDEDKLAGALQRLSMEDTTARLERGLGDQLVLWTMGQTHADLLLARLANRYGVKVEAEPLRIALRETFTAPAKAQGRHVKQSGGHGQYAVCQLEFEPLERGAGFEFVDKVVGGAVPRQFIPSVEKGVQAAMAKGVLAGYPMVDVRVTLVDGKFHPVDSSDMAFQMAGAQALKEAATTQSCTLLEPLDEVTIVMDPQYQGAVMTDLTGRRGRVVGTDAMADGRAVVKALVPAQELARYAIDLRGLAHGSGSFSRTFSGYEQLPAALVEEVLKADAG